MNIFDVKITSEDIQNAMVMLGRMDDDVLAGTDVNPEKVQELLLAAITTKLVRRNPPGFKINQLEVEGTVEGEPFGIKIFGNIKAHLVRDEKRK